MHAKPVSTLPTKALVGGVRQRRGFALALALGLMAFILLLLVSLSTLIQVDSQTQRQQTAIDQARENARFVSWSRWPNCSVPPVPTKG